MAKRVDVATMTDRVYTDDLASDLWTVIEPVALVLGLPTLTYSSFAPLANGATSPLGGLVRHLEAVTANAERKGVKIRGGEEPLFINYVRSVVDRLVLQYRTNDPAAVAEALDKRRLINGMMYVVTAVGAIGSGKTLLTTRIAAYGGRVASRCPVGGFLHGLVQLVISVAADRFHRRRRAETAPANWAGIDGAAMAAYNTLIDTEQPGKSTVVRTACIEVGVWLERQIVDPIGMTFSRLFTSLMVAHVSKALLLQPETTPTISAMRRRESNHRYARLFTDTWITIDGPRKGSQIARIFELADKFGAIPIVIYLGGPTAPIRNPHATEVMAASFPTFQRIFLAAVGSIHGKMTAFEHHDEVGGDMATELPPPPHDPDHPAVARAYWCLVNGGFGARAVIVATGGPNPKIYGRYYLYGLPEQTLRHPGPMAELSIVELLASCMRLPLPTAADEMLGIEPLATAAARAASMMKQTAGIKEMWAMLDSPPPDRTVDLMTYFTV